MCRVPCPPSYQLMKQSPPSTDAGQVGKAFESAPLDLSPWTTRVDMHNGGECFFALKPTRIVQGGFVPAPWRVFLLVHACGHADLKVQEDGKTANHAHGMMGKVRNVVSEGLPSIAGDHVCAHLVAANGPVLSAV